MSLLDNFINKAVSDVKKSKQAGKAGRKARRALQSDEEKLEQCKADIRAIAKACERKEWKEARLVMWVFRSRCTCCGEVSQVYPEAIYLEKHHRRLGKIMTRLDVVDRTSYAHLPREFVEKDGESFLCVDCFTEFTPALDRLIPKTLLLEHKVLEN